MFSGASNYVRSTDLAFTIIFGISLFLLVLITSIMIYFLIRYNRKRNPVATQVKSSNALEITWTLVPIILVMIMFYYGWTGFEPMRNVPKDAMEIKAIGRMWTWSFAYNNGKVSDKLYVPFGKPVKINLMSEDVIHSLYIPAFRIKEDAVPGKNNYLWFIPEHPGTYDVMCAEYCGMRHSYMITQVNVMPEDSFNIWLNAGASASASPVEQGYQLIKDNGCIGCHSTDGTKLVGPSFRGSFGVKKTVISAGKEHEITVDKDYIYKSIVDPNADIVKGFNLGIMPSFKNKISDQDIDKISDYIKSLVRPQ
ncbi:MAG: cytochrome c oxidase subunit II [Bacteroidia bacterium]|nr:cytochrome c oxidase subunit II [Bacteroidia bacterium]